MSLVGSLSDLQAGQLALDGLFVSVCSNPIDTANALFENDFEWQKLADDVNATDTTAEFVLGFFPRRAKLVGLTYVPNGTTGLVASATTYATIQLSWRAGTTTGGASGQLGAIVSTLATSGGTGNWAQWVPVQGVINAFDPNNNVLPVGGILTANIAKASTGTIVPKGTLQARVQYL
jgi:hypothetical protein